jgi:hypothetical protein
MTSRNAVLRTLVGSPSLMRGNRSRLLMRPIRGPPCRTAPAWTFTFAGIEYEVSEGMTMRAGRPHVHDEHTPTEETVAQVEPVRVTLTGDDRTGRFCPGVGTERERDVGWYPYEHTVRCRVI